MTDQGLEWLIYGLLFIGLLIETVADIRKQKIWIPLIIVEIPCLIGLHYLMDQGSIGLWGACLGVGAIFYLISIVTKEQIGKGDAFLLAMAGAGVGMPDMVILLYLTFFIAFFAAAYLWLVKKVGKDYRMPLAPWVFASYCLIVVEKLL